MLEKMQGILEQLNMYFGDKVFLVVAALSFIYLAIVAKDARKKILSIVCMVIFCIINPLVYDRVINSIVYWRAFWLVPDALIIAYALTDMIKRLPAKIILKIMAAVIFIVGIILAGNNAYMNSEYESTKNLYKVSEEVTEICDIILAEDENPKCIMPYDLYCEARQYCGDIKLLYGRNAEAFIILETGLPYIGYAMDIKNGNPDSDKVFSVAQNAECEWVVLRTDVNIDMNIAASYGYNVFLLMDNHIIYYCENLDMY